MDFFKRGDEKPFAPANFAGDYDLALPYFCAMHLNHKIA